MQGTFISWMSRALIEQQEIVNTVNSLSGEQAIEVCRYSSNAKFTINLMCGYFGIDQYNIIKGASNGLELLQFFTEAVDARYEKWGSED